MYFNSKCTKGHSKEINYTFENICRAHTKRQVMIKMNKFNMFITALCVLFFIKLRWLKNKCIYYTKVMDVEESSFKS